MTFQGETETFKKQTDLQNCNTSVGKFILFNT